MARKDVTYASLTRSFIADGVEETERGLVLRVTRGTLRLDSFLHALSLMSATPPALWRQGLSVNCDWPSRASAVVLAELQEAQLTDMAELAARLERLGTAIPAKVLEGHIMSGTIALSLFLQVAFVVRSPSLERYIDLADVAATADGSMV